MLKNQLLFGLLIIFYSFSSYFNTQITTEQNLKIYHFKIDKEITDSLRLYLKKVSNNLLKEAEDSKNKLYLILEFYTPGGELWATLDIVKLLDELYDKNIITIAYINTKALSAGAIIALSCSKIYMNSGSNIGSAAPILSGPLGPITLGDYKEKIVSEIRATMRTRAQRYNRPAIILEAMTDDSFDIYKVTFEDGKIEFLREYEISNFEQQGRFVKTKELIKEKGRLLNLTDIEAKNYGFSLNTVTLIREILVSENIPPNTQILEIRKGIEDYFIDLLESGIVASILSMIGLGALFTFFKTGSITTLFIAIICLSFTPLVKAIIGLSGPIALYLILLGICLVIAELFIIPGTTIVGFLGIISVVVGIVMNFTNLTPPEIPRIVGFSNSVFMFATLTLVGSIILFFLAIKFIPSIPLVNTLILQGGLQEKAIDLRAITPFSVGMQGITVSECKPIGLVSFSGNVIECEAVGEFIKRGKIVTIIDVSNNKIYVKET